MCAQNVALFATEKGNGFNPNKTVWSAFAFYCPDECNVVGEEEELPPVVELLLEHALMHQGDENLKC